MSRGICPEPPAWIYDNETGEVDKTNEVIVVENTYPDVNDDSFTGADWIAQQGGPGDPPGTNPNNGLNWTDAAAGVVNIFGGATDISLYQITKG